MEASGPEAFEEIAEAILDGRPVDWDRVGPALSAAEVRALRRLEAIRGTADTSPAGCSSEPAPPPLASGFEILEEIGRGSFARVYRAVDRALGREVALKVLHEGLAPGVRERFLEEARRLASLDHPNIVRVHSVEEEGGRIRISLERIRGQTLDRWVRERGPLGAEEAALLGVELCRALAALHAKGLIHRDLKPSNVMRAEGGRVVLLDFGVARSAPPLAAEGTAPDGGTPRFRAPEEFGGAPVDGRADLFALGVLLYWAVSGAFPFDALSLAGLKERVLRGAPVPLADRRPDVPPAFAAAVGRALSKSPEDRFPSAGALEETLRTFLSESPSPAGGGPGRRRKRISLALAAALLLGATVFALAGGLSSPSFEFEAALFARRGGEAVRLRSGDAVRIGDQVFLDTKGSRDLHVYVFQEGDGGDLHVLFPLPGFDLGNPLPGGAVHRLPGRFGEEREERDWLRDTPGAVESFLIVASLDPVEEAEAWLREIPPAAPGSPPRALDGDARGRVLRGFGIHAPSPSEALAPGARVPRLDALVSALEEGPGRFRGRAARIVRLRGEESARDPARGEGWPR
ncbi:MAG: serine/threonine-protein kinase [Planctomycetes bacterium]|nr:serine/threonine-protein kinase [Planctomycetota bacterium]